jgi:threonine dehydrogenase-like Zn-dependent dehydrogenase
MLSERVESLQMSAPRQRTTGARLAGSFESGALKPFPIVDDHVFSLDKAADAYRIVFNGAQHRVLLKP